MGKNQLENKDNTRLTLREKLDMQFRENAAQHEMRVDRWMNGMMLGGIAMYILVLSTAVHTVLTGDKAKKATKEQQAKEEMIRSNFMAEGVEKDTIRFEAPVVVPKNTP